MKFDSIINRKLIISLYIDLMTRKKQGIVALIVRLILLISKFYSYMTDKSQPQQVVSMLSLIRLRPECKITPTRVDFTAPLM